MKHIAKLILILIALLAPAIAPAQTATQRQIADAMMKIYDDELRQDPKNYGVYFRRANLFYGLNQYSRALSDVDNALLYTPSTDREMQEQEFALRASIYMMLKQYDKALEDLNRAVEIDPTSYSHIYQRANAEYELGKYADAKEDFRKLARMNPRSLEAYVGLSRVAVKESNLGLANEYIDQAIAFYPAEPEAYLRRASIRRMLGNNTGAADDVIVALSLGNNSQRAISEIVRLAQTDYNSVISALSHAISEAPDNGMFYYIRASIAKAHYHYTSAILDYKTILDRGLYNYYGINADLAQCYFALCRFDEALEEINYAIGATAENGPYYLTLSRIRLAMNDNVPALTAVKHTLNKDSQNNDALIQQGLCNLALENYNDASADFGEVIINKSDDAEAYILRAFVLADNLHRTGDADNFLKRCIEIDFANNDINSLRGFAFLKLGKKKHAKEWIDAIVDSHPTDIDGRLHYLAAALYSQLGEDERALDCMNIALDKGYANLYDWKLSTLANINVAPLRSNPEFDRLLKGYDYLFK